MAGTVGVSKILLSGSTSGKGIKIANTSTTLHTAIATADGLDECWIWAYNSHTADLLITVEFGGTTDPDEVIEYTVPFDDGPHLVVPGLILAGGLTLGAKGGTTNLIVCYGYVNRIWTATA